MRKLIVFTLVVFLAYPMLTLAQDDESKVRREKRESMETRETGHDSDSRKMPKTKEVKEEMAIPEALGSEWDWMIGEWEGEVESPMGNSKEWEKIKYTLDKQFIMIYTKSDYGNMVYQGKGYMTSEPGTNSLVGFWFDNMRGIYKGSGKLEGSKSTMTWSGKGNRSIRIIEKLSDDNYSLTIKMEGPDGKLMEANGEYRKIKKPVYKQDVIIDKKEK